MDTTRLSSKGQIVIPLALRDAHGWAPGLEFQVIESAEGILLKPKTAFAPYSLSDVAGMFKSKAKAKTDEEIALALSKDVRGKWRSDK